MFKQRTGKLIFKALVILPIVIVSGCGGGEGLPTEIENTPTATIETIPTETPIPLPTATLAPTITPTPAIPDEIKTELEERFGEVEIIEKDGVSYIAAKDGRNVGVYAAESENWVVLPEDQPDWRVPAEAEIILNEDKNPVVFGVGSELYKWNEQKSEWQLDMSEIDMKQFSAWAYQLAEEKFGPASQTKYPVHTNYWRHIDEPKGESNEIRIRANLNVWFEGLVEVVSKDDPEQVFTLLSWVRKLPSGEIVRELGLGYVYIFDNLSHSKVAIFSDENVNSRDNKPGDLNSWKEIVE
ncbi:MAG: hypothetical protein ABIG43_04245, partial [Chloroflexota bacterium]